MKCDARIVHYIDSVCIQFFPMYRLFRSVLISLRVSDFANIYVDALDTKFGSSWVMQHQLVMMVKDLNPLKGGNY